MIITIKFSGRFFFYFSISGLGVHNCVSTFPYLIKGKEDKIVTSLIYCLLFSYILGIIKVLSEFLFSLWLDFIQLIKIVLKSVSSNCLIFIIHWTTEDEVLKAFEHLKSCE